MCHIKSALILKDRIFMPDYNSHSRMIEELGLNDKTRHPNFIRAELYPNSGDLFVDVSQWGFHVDQDYTPDWYVAEYDEQRTRKSLGSWAKDRFGKYTQKRKLSELAVDDRFLIGNIEYIIVEKNGDAVSCVTTEVINPGMRFNACSNNYENSEIRKYLHGSYLRWLTEQVGEGNVSGVELLSLEQYEKYREVLPLTEGWCWLSTPWKGSSCHVGCVGSHGDVCYINYNWHNGGVRPFCVFQSSILVSATAANE